MSYFKNSVSWSLVRSHLCTFAVALSFSSSWRAPREGFRYGGLSFALALTVAATLIALPAVLLQLAVGQLSQQDAVGVWRAVPFFKGVGFLRLLISFVGSIYTVIYIAMCAGYIFYTLSNTIPDCRDAIQLDGSLQFASNISICLNDTFLTPVHEQPEYYVALALLIIVLWTVFPFILYNPVKLMKRIFYVIGLTVCLLAIIIVACIGTAEGVSSFNESSDWANFVSPYIWHSAVTQALLSTQTAGGYLISSGDSLYSNTDVQHTTLIVVVVNIITCWTGTLFWFSISGNDSKATHNLAVLIQISNITINRNLTAVWPLLVFFLLFLSGLVTMLTFLYPIYDRFRRVGGYKWRYLSVGSSAVGAGITLATVAFGYFPLVLLEDVVMPLMISLVTLAEISAFIFIYGWKALVEDIEFLIGRKLQRYWVSGWCSAIGIIIPLTAWWAASWFIVKPNWAEPPWEATGIVVTAGLTVILFIIFAAIAIAKQVQYDLVGKLKSSFIPSRHWGPRDPITHYYWLGRREEGRHVCQMTLRNPTLGEFSGASSLATLTSSRNEYIPESKKRSNSDDWIAVCRKNMLPN